MIGALHALKERGEPGKAGDREQPSESSEPTTLLERRLLCAACANFVTELRARIEVNGSHAHTFVNPAGVIYKIGCFSEAPGTVPRGEPSDHWAWFPDFVWQTLACSACFEHLGWSFRGADSSFVGLILERVVEG